MDGRSDFISVVGRFEEFDELTEMTAAWDIDFRQIGKGQLNANLEQIVGKSWAVARARFDRSAYQQGVAVPGMRTFAILDSLAPEFYWCGQLFAPDILAVFGRNGEFYSISPPGFYVYTLSFTEEQLTVMSERLGVPDVCSNLGVAESTLQMGRGMGSVLRRLVNLCIESLCYSNESNAQQAGSNYFRDEIAEQLVLTLAAGTPLVPRPSQQQRSLAVKRALEIIEVSLDNCVSVKEVADLSGMNRRTLEYAFRDRFGVSPKAFINSERLTRVRRDLLTLPDDVPIADIANRWGFWHLGQFAFDYKRRFNELPSATRKR